MKFVSTVFVTAIAIGAIHEFEFVSAKSSNRPNSAYRSNAGDRSDGARGVGGRQPSRSKRIDDDAREGRPRRNMPRDHDDDEKDPDYEDELKSTEFDPYENDAMGEGDDIDEPIRKRQPTPKRPVASQRRDPAFVNKKKPPQRRYDYEDDNDEFAEDDYAPPSRPQYKSNRQDSNPPRRSGPPGRGHPGGRVVQYNRQSNVGAAATLTKGWEALKSSLPDPSVVKDAAFTGISAVQQTTSSLSANLYRELKGITSSELEQVMLKATSPDDTPVKGKHVERLVGVTYQISARYDIYDAVLRKLWSKMAEKDWRTTIKALYILHRFSADGAPEHAPALKARLRELRRTHDPKRKDKYFNSKQLLAGDATSANSKFRAFMSRYAHYVLLRAQCFGGMFEEISTLPKPDKKSKAPQKPITFTSLRNENLEAAAMLLKAGLACQLKEGEECENTAIAIERVASDMIGLTTAVAIALNRALKSEDLATLDSELIKKWCQFYSESLLPQTRLMVKKTSPKLDAYGLFLPSRMGATVPPDLIEKGLSLEDGAAELSDDTKSANKDDPVVEDSVDEENNSARPNSKQSSGKEEKIVDEDAGVEEEEEAGDDEEEYEYEEEEYYEEDEL